MKYLNILFSLILFCSCSKKPIEEAVDPIIDPPNTDSLLIWKVALCAADTTDYLSNKPYLTDDGGVLFTQDFCNPGTALNGHRIFCYEKENGELRWSIDVEDEHYLISRTGLTGKYYWTWHQGRMLIIDVSNGDIVRDQYFPKSTASVGAIGNNMYFILESDKNVNHLRGDYSHLCRTSILGSRIDTIYSLRYDQEGYRPFPTAPSLFIEENGDSSLIYSNRAIRYSKLKYTLLKIDLKTKRLIWVTEKIADQGPYRPPLLDDGRVYINGPWSVHCVDIESGKEVWQRQDVQGGSLCESFVTEDVYIVKDGRKTLFGLDKNTGRSLWTNPTAGTPSTYAIMDAYDGYVYTNISDAFESKLNKFDVKTGNLIWKYESPHNGRISGSFNSGFAIDKKTNIIYASDKRYSMAIRLPH